MPARRHRHRARQNTRRDNVILGERYRTLWGRPAGGCALRESVPAERVPSFYQVNREQAERLYAKAIEFAGSRGRRRCSTSTAARARSRLHCRITQKKVLGAEIVPEAIDDARGERRAQRCGKRRILLRRRLRRGKKLARENLRPDVVITVDCRAGKGLAADVVESIAEMQPQRVVYVSCDSATMARDVKRLADLGYTPPSAPAQWTCSQGRIMSRPSACSPKSELQR